MNGVFLLFIFSLKALYFCNTQISSRKEREKVQVLQFFLSQRVFSNVTYIYLNFEVSKGLEH